MMTTAQMQRLGSAGIAVGCHGTSHHPMTKVADINHELAHARSALERAESRGSHFRGDFPDTGAELYNIHVAGGDTAGLRVWKEPTRLSRLAPDGDPDYVHDDEGADDMAAHARSVLTSSSLQIPVADGRLLLGTWQGIYLWEHRVAPHTRHVVVTVIG